MSSQTKTTVDNRAVALVFNSTRDHPPLTVVIYFYVSLESPEPISLINCTQKYVWRQWRNISGRTALDHAVEVDSEEIILCLLDSGADMEREDPRGARPLDR
jgi:hypothetical protein